MSPQDARRNMRHHRFKQALSCRYPLVARLVILTGVVCAQIFLSFAASAATIERGPSAIIRTGYDPDTPPSCNLRLKGPIVEGDLKRLTTAMAGFSGRSIGDQFDLCLDSPGGSYQEALKIIEHLTKGKGRGVATVIEAGAECLSACALIFMAGNLQGSHGLYPLRYLHAGGRLGFHAPFISRNALADRTYSKETVVDAYRTALAATQKILSMLGSRGNVEGTHQNDPWMSASLIQLMLTKGEDEMLEIDTVDKVGRWGIKLYGHARPVSFDAKAVAIACWNGFGWLKDEYSGYREFGKLSRVEQKADGTSRIFRMMTTDEPGDNCEVRMNSDNPFRYLSIQIGKRSVNQLSMPVVFFSPETRIQALTTTRQRK